MGSMMWTFKVRHPELGFIGPPTLSGFCTPEEAHTERPEEVLSYIANEIGATLG